MPRKLDSQRRGKVGSALGETVAPTQRVEGGGMSLDTRIAIGVERARLERTGGDPANAARNVFKNQLAAITPDQD